VKTANTSISTTPLRFEDALVRNAFKYLQMTYIGINIDLKLLVQKPSLAWNSHSGWF